MSPIRPPFITRTSDGVWYYQRWVPKRFQQLNPAIKPIFRLSLRTKNKNRAIRISRLLTVKIDKLALQYFDSAEDFGRAMEELFKSTYASVRYPNFEDYQEQYLDNIEAIDEWYLDQARIFNTAISKEFELASSQLENLKGSISKGDKLSPDSITKIINGVKELIDPELPRDQNPFLEDLFSLWIDSKNKSQNTISFNDKYKPIVELFIKFANDYEGVQIPIKSLQAKHITHFQKYFGKIPKRVVFSQYSISELKKLKGPLKSSKTIVDYYSYIGTFFNWVESKGYPINPNLQKVLKKGSGVRVDKNTTKERLPFTDDDLSKLFNSEEYTKSRKFSTSAMYWVPLVALFSGARMSEILQLERHDIQKNGNIWLINITDQDPRSKDPFKRVKAKGSIRMFPIHNRLIDLGFLDFVKTKDCRIFDDESRSIKGKFDSFQKKHTYYRKTHGVIPENEMVYKDFHSFRHTVRTRLSELRTIGPPSKRFDSGLIDSILGHESKTRGIGESTYNHSQLITAKYSALNRLDYPSINFDSFVRWDTCDFARKKFRKRGT